MSARSDTERKIHELSFLHEVAQLASSTRDWDELLQIVIDRTTTAMQVEVASLYLVERRENLLRLVATNGLDRRGIGRVTLRMGEGITGWVANGRVPAVVRDVRTDPRWKHVRMLDVERLFSMASVPLFVADEVVGVINVQTVGPREFSRAEIAFLQAIANQVAGTIEKARLHRDSERKLREVSALFEVSNVLTSTLDLDEVLHLIVDRLVRVYPNAACAIVLRDSDGEQVRASSGDLGTAVLEAASSALKETRPIVGFDHLALPLLAGDKVLGAVALQVPDYREFTGEEVAFVGTLANQAALAIDKASLYELERRTAEELRELERARAEFVAVVTHDLRTPLSIIRGHLDLLGDKNGKSAQTREAIAQVERIDHLVDRILAGVRIEQPDLTVRKGRFDLRTALAAGLRELAPIATRHKLVAPRGTAPLRVRADKRRTVEVVGGLVHNATKYAPEGTRITVGVTTKGDSVVVRIADHGPGVAPEDRLRIFSPYMRVGDTSRARGTGIGLYAASRVVDAMGGELWYEENEGGGSVFAFSLPAAKRA